MICDGAQVLCGPSLPGERRPRRNRNGHRGQLTLIHAEAGFVRVALQLTVSAMPALVRAAEQQQDRGGGGGGGGGGVGGGGVSRIVAVSSGGGKVAVPKQPVYSAAKHGQWAIDRSWLWRARPQLGVPTLGPSGATGRITSIIWCRVGVAPVFHHAPITGHLHTRPQWAIPWYRAVRWG